MVPVISRGVTVGLLEGCRTDDRPWARSQINRARIVGYQLGQLLEHLGRIRAGATGPGLKVLPGGGNAEVEESPVTYPYRGAGI